MRVAAVVGLRRALAPARTRAAVLCRGWLSSGPSAVDAGLHKSPITDALWKQRQHEKDMHEGAEATGVVLPPQTELLTKTPSDSAVVVRYPFSTDAGLRDRYLDCWGGLDKGILLEDLDALAGNVSYRHAVMGNGKGFRPPILVTATVDEVRMRGSLRPDGDLCMSGRVVFVGKSSMLVRCEVAPVSSGATDGATAGAAPVGQALLVADFLYVARDRVSGKAQRVNKLDVSAASEADRRLHADKAAEAEVVKAARSADAALRLQQYEARLGRARALVEQSQPLIRMPSLAGSSAVLVSSTELQNTMICQPQQRNTSGRIFGGFLMRRAYELALSTAYCFGGRIPRFLWSDEISFSAPVCIGDVLRLDSRVICTEPHRARVHCEVFASVLRPEGRSSTLSNRFAFSFCLEGAPAGSAAGATTGLPAGLPLVLPSRTGEAMTQLAVLDASAKVPDWNA